MCVLNFADRSFLDFLRSLISRIVSNINSCKVQKITKREYILFYSDYDWRNFQSNIYIQYILFPKMIKLLVILLIGCTMLYQMKMKFGRWNIQEGDKYHLSFTLKSFYLTGICSSLTAQVRMNWPKR